MALRISIKTSAFDEACCEWRDVTAEATVNADDWSVSDLVLTPDIYLVAMDRQNLEDELRDEAERIASMCSRCEQGPFASTVCLKCDEAEDEAIGGHEMAHRAGGRQ